MSPWDVRYVLLPYRRQRVSLTKNDFLSEREPFVYYVAKFWETGYVTSKNFTEHENLPRSQWPSRSDSTSDFARSNAAKEAPDYDAIKVESVETADSDGNVKVWGYFGDQW